MIIVTKLNGEIMQFRVNKKTKIVLRLTITAILLLSLPFLVKGAGILILFALIPVLMLQNFIENNEVRYGWIPIYLIFLAWTVITTYWIGFANFKGAVASMLIYALPLTIIVKLHSWYNKKLGSGVGYAFFILSWLAWEHIMAEGELNWPWLALGNGFASSHKLVQWYEFTGVSGGSLWVLLFSVFAYDIIITHLRCGSSQLKAKNLILVLILIIPIFTSHALYITYKETYNPATFLIVQPNIDPYHDKFGGMSQKQQDELLIDLINKGYDNTVDFVIAPETFTSGVIENNPYESDSFKRIAKAAKSIGDAKLIIGVSSHLLYPVDKHPSDKRPTPSSRWLGEGWYDSHNSALMIDSTGKYQFYYKSKLVPLVEFMPFQKYLGGFRLFVIELGGYFGSYGKQDERSLLSMEGDQVSIGTAICYESVYGNFFREFVLKGANVMSIITNDGWWLNSPGYKQHLWFDKLRAIETRRSLARCGNTGISALINQKGDIISQTKWWSREWLKGDINLNNKITVFAKYGDYIGRVSYLSMLIFFALAIFVLTKISVRARG